MQNPFKKDSDDPIDEQITAVLSDMTMNGVDSEEYPKMLTNLERLYEIKAKMRLEPLSRDTFAVIAGNLMGILMIVAYEQKHVITSTKGLNQILRPRA